MSDRFSHGYALLIGVGECAYPEAHLRILRNAETTRQAILDGLDWLAERSAADPEATAVVYYSGHGWLEEGSGCYYVIPHDVTPFDPPGSALAAEAFTAALREVRAQRLLVFLDCCHAGGMATAKGGAQGATPLPPA